MKKFLFLAIFLVICSLTPLWSQEQFGFRPDKRHIVSMSVGNFFNSQGSVFTPSVAVQYLYGGVFQIGYEYRKEPHGILTSHGPKFVIFPITSELVKIGVGYSPLWITYNPALHDLFYERGPLEIVSSDKQDGIAGKYEERYFMHGIRIDFYVRLSKKFELSGGPLLGALNFSGGTVGITYRP